MMVAVSALVLVHHLHTAVSPRARDGIRLAVAALAAFWLIDLLLAAAAYAGIEDRSPLIAIRGFAVAALAPELALAVHRNSDWSLRLSRRSEAHKSELSSLMRISYAAFCLKKKQTHTK